jgi:hypothetical protein
MVEEGTTAPMRRHCSAHRSARTAFALLLALGGCTSSGPASPGSAPTRSAPAAPGAAPSPTSAPGGRRVDPSAVRVGTKRGVLEALDDIEAMPELDESPQLVRRPEEMVGAVAAPATLDAAAPPHGCVAITRAPTRALAEGGPASLASTLSGFVVAAYTSGAGGESVSVVRLSPSSPTTPIATLSLGAASPSPRLAPPALAALDDGRVMVAATDARGEVRAGVLGVSAPSMRPALASIGRGADLRFSPAIAPLRGGAAAVAWTDGSGTPMRVRMAVVRFDGRVTSTHDLTPQSLGASAPVATRVADVPEFVFLDARGGLSPVVRVALDEEGAPRPPTIERPLSTVSEPARLAAGNLGARRLVAYTAIGRAATSAIGVVELGGTAPPVPLVPGEGYGMLHVAAVSAPAAVVFGLTRPRAGIAPTERFHASAELRLVDEAGPGPALAVGNLNEPVSHLALARADDGTLGAAVTSASGVSVSWLRCADRGSPAPAAPRPPATRR